MLVNYMQSLNVLWLHFSVFTVHNISILHSIEQRADYMIVNSLFFTLRTSGHAGVPQVFFNSRHVGGVEEIEEIEKQGVLGDRVKECLEGGSEEEFPPPLRTPSPEEYLQVKGMWWTCPMGNTIYYCLYYL